MPTGCLTILILIAAFCALIMVVVVGAMKSSDVYRESLAAAQRNPDVIEALGSPIKEGFMFSGKTSVEGPSGEADLAIPISGPKGKGTIYAVAKKSAGKWSYSTLAVEVQKTGARINLIE